jgi:phosphoenolpyruvate---glycerone phosphotransferase subunit DhaK
MKAGVKMKKLINDPFKVTDELVEGFVLANAPRYRKLDDINVVLRSDMPRQGKVAIVIGGGSGHEPLFLEYIGRGMGDCSIHGNIFTSPSVDMIYEGITTVNSGSGVLLIYGNYMGDILNFDMAQDLARMDGIRVESIRVWDDIASGAPDHKENRRGTSADVFVIKVAGAASEMGLGFDDVCRLAAKARDNCRSLGVALSSCTLPAVGKPIFLIDDDTMMLGMGLHGEPGMEKRKMMTADATAELIMSNLLADDLLIEAGDEIALIVNSYGATTRMELLIVSRKIHQLMQDRRIQIHATYYGDLCTSQEMSGLSITIMKLDKELSRLLDQPAVSPGLTVV